MSVDVIDMPVEKQKVYTTQFWLLCLSSYLFFSSFNMIIPELPKYLTSLGGEDYKGLIISLFTLTALLSRPFSGKLTDTIGRIPVMVVGAAVCFAIGFLYPILNTVSGFLLVRFLHGFSTGFKPTGTAAYIADIVPADRRGEAMGVLGVFGSMGMATGLFVGSPIANAYSWEVMFYASSCVSILSIAVLLGMKETLQERRKPSLRLLKVSRHEIIEPKVFKPSIVMVMTSFSFGIMLTIMPDFSEHLGIENKGLFFASFIGASILVRVLAGKVSDRFGRVIVMRVSAFCLALSMIYVGMIENLTMLLLGSVFFGLSYGMNSPTLFAWTADLGNPKFIGRAMSTVFIALEIGIGTGALLSAFVYDNKVENFPWAFWSGAILSFLAFVTLMFMKRDSPPRQP
ncbi:MAG: MFS transporter [Bacteroidota bacterium]